MLFVVVYREVLTLDVWMYIIARESSPVICAQFGLRHRHGDRSDQRQRATSGARQETVRKASTPSVRGQVSLSRGKVTCTCTCTLHRRKSRLGPATGSCHYNIEHQRNILGGKEKGISTTSSSVLESKEKKKTSHPYLPEKFPCRHRVRLTSLTWQTSNLLPSLTATITRLRTALLQSVHRAHPLNRAWPSLPTKTTAPPHHPQRKAEVANKNVLRLASL